MSDTALIHSGVNCAATLAHIDQALDEIQS